jgi:hypothetical protein
MARRAAHRRFIVAAAIAALGLALGPAGCVLFVPDEQLGTECHFAGAGSPCGECVSAHCQESVNACCASSTCAPTLASLEDCTTGESSGCADLATEGVPLALCVQSACTGTCVTAAARDAAAAPPSDSATSDSAAQGSDSALSTTGDGATPGDASMAEDAPTSGTACALGEGTSECICIQSTQPNNVQCGLDTFSDQANTVCYQQQINGQWQCECDHMGCHMENAGFCTCELPDTHPLYATCDQTGMTCCVAGFSECDCSAPAGGDCTPDIQVDTCTLSGLEQDLPSDYVLVESCSGP